MLSFLLQNITTLRIITITSKIMFNRRSSHWLSNYLKTSPCFYSMRITKGFSVLTFVVFFRWNRWGKGNIFTPPALNELHGRNQIAGCWCMSGYCNSYVILLWVIILQIEDKRTAWLWYRYDSVLFVYLKARARQILLLRLYSRKSDIDYHRALYKKSVEI